MDNKQAIKMIEMRTAEQTQKQIQEYNENIIKTLEMLIETLEELIKEQKENNYEIHR